MPDSVPQTPTFLGMAPEIADPRRARFALLPVPYETGARCRRGARFGPDAVVRASRFLSPYDEETEIRLDDLGIATLPAVDVTGSPPEAFERTAVVVESLLQEGKFVVMLGGENGLAEGALSAAARVHGRLSILQLDAHAGLCRDLRGSPYHPGCVARRMASFGKLVQVGIRNISADEAEWGKAAGVTTFLRVRTPNARAHVPEVLRALERKVYLSVSLHALDPSIVPAVGSPVPGGLGWEETLGLLRAVIREKTVVAADVTELCPIADEVVSDLAAARLIARLFAYQAARSGRPRRRGKKP